MPPHGALVIGIGNRLRGDDAVGPLVADVVGARHPVRVIEHGGESLSLMNAWSGADAVVLIDAVRSGAPAGRIHRIDLIEQSLDLAPWTCSTHAFSLPDTLELARGLGRLPRRLIFFGVEAVCFDVGASMTAEVAAAVAPAAERIAREIRQHL